MFQCLERRIEPGPINTFPGWLKLNRFVKKREKALVLCMPVTVKRKIKEPKDDPEAEPKVHAFTAFTFKARWFALSQTDGEPYIPTDLPEWKEALALEMLSITRAEFHHPNGNCQGYAMEQHVAVSPIAVLPWKTLFHELGHVVIGHTKECGEMIDHDITPKNIREVEAESVALICCESLGLGGADACRGYIQAWLRGDKIADASAQRIFKAADVILKAGRPEGKGE